MGDAGEVGAVVEEGKKGRHGLLYSVEESPGVGTLLLFGFQQVMVCISGVMTAPLIIADTVCAKYVPLARVLLIGTMLFVAGISTLLQVTLGSRLPLIQGASFSFFPAIIAFVAFPDFRCTDLDKFMLPVFLNGTKNPNFNETAGHLLVEELGDSEWMSRLAIIQGSLMAASCVQMLIGLTGLIGVITRYVGPLTIAPLMLLLEISVIDVCFKYLTSHWFSVMLAPLLFPHSSRKGHLLACRVLLTLMVTALYLHNVKVPIPTFSRAMGCHSSPQPIFALFPVSLGCGGWVSVESGEVLAVLDGDSSVLGVVWRADSGGGVSGGCGGAKRISGHRC